MKMSRVKYQFMTMIFPLACLRLLLLTTPIILGEIGSGGGGGGLFYFIYIYRHDRYHGMSGEGGGGGDEGGGAGESGHMAGVLNPSLSSLVPLA